MSRRESYEAIILDTDTGPVKYTSERPIPQTNADVDRWEDDIAVEDYHEPFRAPHLSEETRERANREVALAIAVFKSQSKWRTFLARARFAAFWTWYKLRERLGIALINFLGYVSKKDRRLVSQKVTGWLRLLDKEGD